MSASALVAKDVAGAVEPSASRWFTTMSLIGRRPGHCKHLKLCRMLRGAQVMNHRNVGSALQWRESTHAVQNTWTWHGTDDFLELKFSEEPEELAAL
jgi:hypothetical protein